MNAVVAKARNDKWIDDFHVIVTAGKPDPALLEAIKKKAAAWKVAKRNFSSRTAADAHDKATDDAMAIAKRLGARWIQQGAVTRVVMPNAARSRNAVVAKAMNAVATNVKSYPFYVVDKAMKGKCIFSGRYELSDANDDVAELKKSGVESKAVPRRVLLMSGIDPDEESSWKKNHQKD